MPGVDTSPCPEVPSAPDYSSSVRHASRQFWTPRAQTSPSTFGRLSSRRVSSTTRSGSCSAATAKKKNVASSRERGARNATDHCLGNAEEYRGAASRIWHHARNTRYGWVKSGQGMSSRTSQRISARMNGSEPGLRKCSPPRKRRKFVQICDS